MARIKICREESCQNAATTKGYCRLHYLCRWKDIKKKERERAAKKLNRYIESVMRKSPGRYMDVIKEDLRSSKLDGTAEDVFGYRKEEDMLFNEPTYEEEIEKLIEDLKIEKGF